MAGIQKIAEVQNDRAPLWTPYREFEMRLPDADAVRGLTALARDVSSQLRLLSVSEAKSGYASTLESLAGGLNADQVSLYLPSTEEDVFEVVHRWERAPALVRGVDSVLDLGMLPSLAGALRAGTPHRIRHQADMNGPAAKRASVSESGWQSGSSTLYLPCCGPEGMLGLVVIEAGLSAAYWTQALVAAALEMAEILAAFLERRRLSLELEAERARRGHDSKLQVLGRVANSVAHDFNNLLTAILGYGDLLELELTDSAAGRAELRELVEAANRATHLVDEVLSFGRPRPTGLEPIDLGDTLEGLLGIMRRLVGARVEIELDIAPDLVAIQVDAGALERIVLNLASNARDAIEATPRRLGRFVLEARDVSIGADFEDPMPERAKAPAAGRLAAGRYIRLTARDDGCGLDPRAREHLFESFFTTKGPGHGNGLGLATATETMRAAGGVIRLAEQAGQGTAFHLYFPILPDRSNRKCAAISASQQSAPE